MALLLTLDSDVVVDHSHLVGKLAAVHLENASTSFTANFSLLQGLVTSTLMSQSVLCRPCSGETTPLDSLCAPVP